MFSSSCSGSSPGGSGGNFPLPSSMELSPAPTGHREEKGGKLRGGAARRPPNPHPTGICGGGRRASPESGFCLFSLALECRGVWRWLVGGNPASFLWGKKGQDPGPGFRERAQKPARGLSCPAWVKAACASRCGARGLATHNKKLMSAAAWAAGLAVSGPGTAAGPA